MAPPSDESRPRRSVVEVRIARYFGLLGVGAEAAAALAAGSFLHRTPAGRFRFTSRHSYVDIIVDGVVFEADRIWAGEHWVGELDVFRETPQPFARTWVDYLCTTVTIRISREVLRSWAVRDLTVQRMLFQVLTDRQGVMNIVYGLDHRSTLARVAQLLDYLAHTPAFLDEVGLSFRGGATLHGPTQKHLADALGLSLTSVEKSMNLLRKHEILASAGGGRAHRAYSIKQPQLLEAVAQGHALAAA
ncbi:Crp/Fnr family transcriptional regulator [Streptomyces nitrosporeus]|uniref:Crp/Fnr family transcriptional regulator n=1 Tax=Streptomyces nitrosporeus TaxID=28894 RepID=UPI00333410CB